jgi:predicted permease
VVILSDGYWHAVFNGDRSVIGRTLRISKTTYTVIGVMPPGFHFLAYDARLWLPLCFSDYDKRNDLRHGGGGEMVSRLRPGATLAQAQAQIDALNARTIMTDPMGKAVLSVGFHTTVLGLHAFHVAGLRPVLLLLQTAVLFLLLIGTVNLANLFMVRATSRAREFMLRQVLGAGRIQLVRTILAETLLLSLAGGLLGVGVGAAAIRGMTALAANRLPSDVLPSLDPTVCLAAVGASGVLALLLALPVIWLTGQRSPAASLAVESRGGTTTRAVHRLRHTLIVAQVALAFVLLSCAGFLGLSFVRVLDVKPGFERQNLLTSVVALPPDGYKEPGQRLAFIGKLASAARSMPGVSSAALSNGTPFSGRVWDLAWFIAGATASSDEFVKEAVYTYFVTGDYFATLGVPLREGRLLTDDDYRLSRKVCVIDEEFANRHWPRHDALGHQMVLPIDPKEAERQFVTIVGVVGSVKQDDLADRADRAAVYFPIGVPSEFPVPSDFMVSVRTQFAPEAAGPGLRAAVMGIDRSAELYDMKTMDTRVGDSLVDRRTPLVLAWIFAGVSLALTVVGIYSVLSFSVAQRRREIGVRMALGARPEQIMGQFVGMGLRLLGIGLPLGLLGAWLAGRALAGALYGVTPASPLVLCCTAALLAAVAMPACLLPSQRAAHVAPAEALRSD